MTELHAMCPDDVTAVEDTYPVTPLQHGMLFHGMQSLASGVDIEQLVCELKETIDPVSFAHAWRVVAASHPILRTRFSWLRRDVPVQEVMQSIETPVVEEDLQELAEKNHDGDLEEAFRAYLVEDRSRGFDLATAPLWRVTLFRLGADAWRMVWTYSHTLLDNSFAFVLHDVELTYQAEVNGLAPELESRRPYREHCVWLAEHLESSRAEAKAFYREMLRGFSAPTNLAAIERPSEGGAPSLHGSTDLRAGSETKSFRLSRATSEALRALRKEEVGVSVVAEAAWALALAAFNGADDVVFGATRSCRASSVPGAESMVGLFINTLPVRAKVDPERPVIDWLRDLRAQQRAIRPFEHTSLVDAMAMAEVARGTALFETVVVYNDAHADARMKRHGGAWANRSVELYNQMTFPCSFLGYGDEEILFRVEYDPHRFDAEAIDRLCSLTRDILESIAREPTAKVRDLPSLPAEDAQRLLGEWRGASKPIAGDPCVHRQIEAQAKRTPERTAVVFRDASLTYGALNARANQLAKRLRDLGVGPGSLVGIFVERSIEMVVGLYGILKAGGAYVPMDPGYPSARITMMLEDTKASVVVTLASLRSALPTSAATVLYIDDLVPVGDDAAPSDVPVTGDDLAYSIFTSGSTGRPKGALIRHRNVTSFFTGMDGAIGRGPAPDGGPPGVWLALTSISFDISVLEILWTLARGFTVVVQEGQSEHARRAAGHDGPTATKGIDFSLFYFAADASTGGKEAYKLLLDGARFADTHGFRAVWTPERHFHPFGGLYPNPAVTGAAVAAVTEHIDVRAGSVVLPLHNPIRCAEEWAVVDNLSNGRVGLSFASGWHSGDFAIAPDHFQDRRRLMAEGIETVRKLWRGEAIAAKGGDGKDIEVRIFPRPVQKEPPIWLTATGSPETFAAAGRMGANILTNLLVMTPEDLRKNISVYREAYEAAGHPGEGCVSLMLHTFVGADVEAVRGIVREPFLEYLRTSTDLINKTRWELTAFAKPSAEGASSADGVRDLADLTDEEMNVIMDHAFERYVSTSGLFGTPQSCLAMVDRLKAWGVSEIACLVDFGVAAEVVLENLRHLDELRALSRAPAPKQGEEDYSIPAQVKRHGITHLQCTPTLAGLLAADGAGLAALGSLDTLLLGGEALPSALVDRLRPVLRGRLFNMYGPTETTVWSTFTEVGRDGGDITIGRPIANTRVYVVDRHLELAPVGVPGELVIGGAGVTAGYLDRPELTAERFVSLSRDEGVAYRTGDLVRWRRDGTLEFLGRLDQQVKIRGFRIELGEVESTLARHPEVQDAVVVARTDGGTDARLVAYVIGKEAGEAAPDPQAGTRGGLSTRLRAYLRDRLPEYMIPGAFVALESFPQTPNGKVDRKALPALDRTAMATSTGYAAPTSDVEKIIAAIWQEMLSMDRVGVDHNFFELGANSLLMVKANVRLRAKLETEVPLVDMFRFPTVRTLAAHVVGGGLGTAELLRETQKRVQARRDALSTRRTARRGSRAEDE